MSDNIAFNSRSRSLILGGGGLLLAVSPYLTWVSLAGFVNVDLFGLVRLAHYKQLVAFSPVIFGLILILSVLVSVPYVQALRSLAIVYSILIPFIGGVSLTKLVRAVSDSQGVLHFGVGFVALAAAEILFLIAALYPTARPVQVSNASHRRLNEVSRPVAVEGVTTSTSKWTLGSMLESIGESAEYVAPKTTESGSSRTQHESRCVTCRRDLDPNFLYCPKCGTAAIVPEVIHCQNCQSVVEQGDEYCHQCGQRRG